MIRQTLLVLGLLVISVFSFAQSNYNTDRGFVHPGCLHTNEDFDRIRKQLEDGNPTVVEGYNKLRLSPYASSSFITYPVETIIRGGGSGENYMNAARGGAAAYLNAVMWKITGNKAHANTAITILNKWAGVCTAIAGDSNYALAAGLYGYAFVNAAELMRDYEGWNAADQQKVKTWFMNVWYPVCIGFLRGRNATWENPGKWWQAPGHYWSNWGLCNTLCVMSIGIYLDDVFIYNQGLSFYKYDHVGTFKDMTPAEVIAGDGYIWNWGLTEYIGNLVPIESDCTDATMTAFGKISQMQESGRDQGHAAMAGGLAIDICQTGLSQGDDLYALMNDRLAGGLEHVAAFNNGGVKNLPFVTYKIQTTGFTIADGRGGTHTADADYTGYHTRPGWTRALAYYEGLRGVKMKYAHMAQEALGIECGPGYYGETSGGFDQLGYGTALSTRPACDPADAIYVLKTSITCNGKTYNQNNIGALRNTYAVNVNTAVEPGTELTFTVALPGGVADDGQWLWDDGSTVPVRTVKAERSMMYHVQYTSARGIVSKANFTVAVQSDSRPDPLVPSITVGDNTVNDTIVFVEPGEKVVLSAKSRVGWTSASPYVWSNGSKTESITIMNICQPETVTCTYTNQNKVESNVTFHIYVRENYVMPEGNYYIINRETGEYLTNDGTSSPVCAAFSEGDSTQMWHIASDSDRFKLTSVSDDRILGGFGNFLSGSYNYRFHTFLFEQYQGTDYYNITRMGTTITYWIGWSSNGHLATSMSKTPLMYPFIIKPVSKEQTSIKSVMTEKKTDSRCYTIDGIAIHSNRVIGKSIIIRNGKKIYIDK